MKAVQAYVEGSASYKAIAEQEGIRNCSQLKVWGEKHNALCLPMA
ncbi:hypothetical protein I8J29_21185 [Paenibacillus sp. MWE-103]|uniref:Transposase n=1 Tax=Paenibacillus artemisiicola TaxID=1172618 RepID=A0ABS3WEI3_9BACL|nr:hypothetical protein [Paenibacillus artemisiicola]